MARLYATTFVHAPLSVKRGLLQCTRISSVKTSCPLSGVKRCPLFRGSVYINYIGRSASAWVGCPLDGDVLLFGVSIIRGSTVLYIIKSTSNKDM